MIIALPVRKFNSSMYIIIIPRVHLPQENRAGSNADAADDADSDDDDDDDDGAEDDDGEHPSIKKVGILITTICVFSINVAFPKYLLTGLFLFPRLKALFFLVLFWVVLDIYNTNFRFELVVQVVLLWGIIIHLWVVRLCHM